MDDRWTVLESFVDLERGVLTFLDFVHWGYLL